MSPNNEIESFFNEIDKRIQHLLFADESINEDNQPYFSVNFKSHIIDPFLQEIRSRISILPQGNLLLGQTKRLIKSIDLFLENDYKKLPKRIGRNQQKGYLKYVISELTKIQEEIEQYISLPVNDLDDSTLFTSLNRKETVLLMLYMQEAKIFKPFNYLKDTEFSECFSKLTGYQARQIGKLFSIGKEDKRIMTDYPSHYYKLIETLKSIIMKMEEDLKPLINSK